MNCLEALDVQVRGPTTGAASALASHAASMPFRLRTFTTNIFISDGLAPLLRAQSDIETYCHDETIPRHFAGLGIEPAPLPSIDESFLPKLKYLSHLPDHLVALTTGRPVESITAFIDQAAQIDQVATAIERSVVPVTHLDITVKPNTLIETLLQRLGTIARPASGSYDGAEDLVLGCPARTMILNSAHPPHGYTMEFVTDNAVSDMLSGLTHAQGSGFPSLRRIHWRGNLSALARRPGRYTNPSLREVLGDGYGDNRPIRQVLGDDEKWKLEVEA